jgi:hypothetical protein
MLPGSWTWMDLRRQVATAAEAGEVAVSRKETAKIVKDELKKDKKKKRKPCPDPSVSSSSSTSSSTSSSSSSAGAEDECPVRWFHTGGKVHIEVSFNEEFPIPACRWTSSRGAFAKKPIERGVGLTEAALARGICASCRKTGYLASSEVVKATAKSSGLPVIDR